MKKISYYLIALLFAFGMTSCAYKTCATYSSNDNLKTQHTEIIKVNPTSTNTDDSV